MSRRFIITPADKRILMEKASPRVAIEQAERAYASLTRAQRLELWLRWPLKVLLFQALARRWRRRWGG